MGTWNICGWTPGLRLHSRKPKLVSLCGVLADLCTCPWVPSALPASSPPPGGRAPGKGHSPEPGAGHPAALPGRQSCPGGGGADGRQGQCLWQAGAKGGLASPGCMGQGPGEGSLSLSSPSQSLQMELSRAQEAWRRGQQQAVAAEEQLKLVVNAVGRCLRRGGWGRVSASPASQAPWS